MQLCIDSDCKSFDMLYCIHFTFSRTKGIFHAVLTGKDIEKDIKINVALQVVIEMAVLAQFLQNRAQTEPFL